MTQVVAQVSLTSGVVSVFCGSNGLLTRIQVIKRLTERFAAGFEMTRASPQALVQGGRDKKPQLEINREYVR